MLHRFIKEINRIVKAKPKVGSGKRGVLGAKGEKMAVKYLKKEKGCRVIDRNWRCKRDEIDIVARDGEVVVFVEVRTRTDGDLRKGFKSVTNKKKEALGRVCRAYLRRMRHKPKHIRFDIIVVKFCQEGESTIQQYSNVPLFPKNFHALKHD